MRKLRFLSFIILFIIVFSSISFAENNKDFKDIKSSDWFYSSVNNLSSKGIISGYSDDTFRPNNSVTTAEFLKLSMETAEIEIDYNTTPWNKGIMDKALSLNIITKDLYNKPNEPIKRKDVALVLSKLIEKTDLKDEFIRGKDLDYDRFKYLLYDTTKLSEEYRNAIYKLFEYQLIVGTTNKKDQVFYSPEDNLTRAEIVAIVERLIDPSKRLDKYAEYPNRDNVFNHEGLGDMFSTSIATPDIENKRLLFNYEKRKYEVGKEEVEPARIVDGTEYFYSEDIYEIIENVPLSEELNPNINKQVYELVKATIDKDKNYFVNVRGFDYGSEENKVFYQVAKTELHAINYHDEWNFLFNEKMPFDGKENTLGEAKEFSRDVVISFQLGSLWQDFAPDGWVDWFYADKLRASFIALFEEKNGHEIYEYVLDEYVKYRLAGSNESTGHKYVYRTKTIDNIQIDFTTGWNAILHFDFSYTK